MAFDIQGFLKKHRALMSYIYDSNGFRRGVIISVPDDENRRPLIGWAMFDEVVTRCVKGGKVVPEYYIGNIFDIPIFKEALEEVTTIARGRSSALNFRNMQCIKGLPNIYATNICRNFETDLGEDGLRDCILLAHSRCNSNDSSYFVSDSSAYHNMSVLSPDADNPIIALDVRNALPIDAYSRDYMSKMSDSHFKDSIRDRGTITKVRKKIKSFEYRAYKYYKYLPSSK